LFAVLVIILWVDSSPFKSSSSLPADPNPLFGGGGLECHIGEAGGLKIPFALLDAGPNLGHWLLFALYGLYMGMTEGIQRAFVATLIPKEYKATAYGAYHTLIGVAAFPASFIGGLLWDRFGSPALFIYGAGMAALASGLFVGFLGRSEPR
jgi:predicted MFS family arabinose efflux permease